MNDRLLYVIVKLLLPVIVVYGVIIVLHGHLTPGGGFSGGAILGTALVLYGLTFGQEASLKIFPESVSKYLESGGVLAVIIIGLIGLFVGGYFLSNADTGIPLGEPGNLISGGFIPLLMIAIGIKVGSTLMTLFNALLEDE
jgi:multicomponent Na+:H+ antiporter subunit B